MNDREFIEDRRRALKASIEYFSVKKKAERERWVCAEFFRNLGVRHEDAEISTHADEPPDVVFRDARFEIKEILDPGRRRHAEYKADLEAALKATKPQDFLEHFTPEDITPAEIAARVQTELDRLESRFARATRAGLDILFYVNLLDHFLKSGPMPDAASFTAAGWRSISAVNGAGALIFFAADDAPSFLRDGAGRLSLRNGE